jgi:hypothetical protein
MRTIDESEPETQDNLESDECFECPECGDLLIHTVENPDAICPKCHQEGPPAKADEILERWRAYPLLVEDNKRMSEALTKIAAVPLEGDSEGEHDEDDESKESLSDYLRAGADAEDALVDAVRTAREALKSKEPKFLGDQILSDPLTLANFRFEFVRQEARIKRLQECLGANLTAWEGEEDSVKEEHAELIRETNEILGYEPHDEDGDGEREDD